MRRLSYGKHTACDAVLDVDRRLDGIRPKILVVVLVSHHGACHLHENSVASLSNPVLLRRVEHRRLVRRAVLKVKCLACGRHVLVADVGPEHLDLVAGVQLSLGQPLLVLREKIALLVQEDHVRPAGEVVGERAEVERSDGLWCSSPTPLAVRG